MRTYKVRFIAVLVSLFSCAAFSQANIVWTRTAFEAGVKYTEADQIAQITTTCGGFGAAADWYNRSISWKTGDPATPLASTGVPHRIVQYKGANRDVVFNGTYPVFANNQLYSEALVGQTTTATLSLRLHCLDYTNQYADIPRSQTVKIFDRIPVADLQANATTVQGGKPIALRIIISAAAQQAGTRVELEWSGEGTTLIAGVPPDHVDVPTTATSVDLSVPTKPNPNGPKQLTVTAKTKTSKQIIVSITR